MKILICGSRNFSDTETIKKFIDSLPDDSTIIEGEAKGADSLARNCATERGLIVEKYPADWKKYGKSAGPIRNKQMLDEGEPDYVVGYTTEIENSRGTRNMLNQATERDIPSFLNVKDWLDIKLSFVEEYQEK